MQEALARALGHSTGSKVVLLDEKVLESVSRHTPYVPLHTAHVVVWYRTPVPLFVAVGGSGGGWG